MRYRLRPIGEQVMVITGASSGIGLVTARKAAAAGAKVLLVARGEEALARAATGICASGGTALHAVADVGVPAEIEAAAGMAIQRFGRIDSWVNNAGVAAYAMLEDMPLDEHERMVRTNYFGVVNSVRAALPHLKAQGGALITVGSIASDIPSPIMGAYAATKHAVRGFIESLRIELISQDAPVSVTLVKPSGVDTPIGRNAANHREGEAMIPPPVYDPEIVADTILFVAQNPRREMTVGGVGRAQVLFGTHFPQLLDYLARFMIPLLNDPRRSATASNNLFAPALGGEERSGIKRGRGFSLYTTAQRHRGMIGMAATMLAGAGLAMWGRRLLASKT